MLNKKNNKQSNNNSNKKLPKFNFYWIYGIVAVVLIGINLMNFNGFYTKKIEENQLWEWIDKQKVQQVEIVNNSEVKVYINKKYINDLNSLTTVKTGIITSILLKSRKIIHPNFTRNYWIELVKTKRKGYQTKTTLK